MGSFPRLALALAVFALSIGAAPAGAVVYWANSGNRTIGRANNDGSSVDQAFVPDASAATGLATISGDPYRTQPYGLAVDGAHVYWSDSSFCGCGGITTSSESLVG